LEDTIVALRPIIPTLPFEVPNSARPLSPMMPLGSTLGFNNVDANGNPTSPITNAVTNFGWEYVYHCHILSHEEMDMMRPVSVMLPPNKPTGLSATYITAGPNRTVLSWTDMSINETRFVIQRQVNGGTWVTRATVSQPLEQDLATGKGPRTFTDPGTLSGNSSYAYRVLAQNVIGYGSGFMQQIVQSISNTAGAPTGVASLTSVVPGANGPGNQRRLVLSWTYAPGGDQTGFTIQRATNAAFSNPTTIQVGDVLTYTNTGLARNTTYYYRVRARNAFGWTVWSNVVSRITNP
jgi:hypothetical protein